jgi:8-oxo-dGTP diphosphatase
MSKKPVGAAAVILDADGRVLLVKHSYGKLNWELPGGLSELNESAEETAKREVKEETGLDVTVGQMTGVYYEPANDMHHFVFRCNNLEGQNPKPSSPEILECMYCHIDDLPKPMSDFTYNRIQAALHPDSESLFHVIGPRQWIE